MMLLMGRMTLLGAEIVIRPSQNIGLLLSLGEKVTTIKRRIIPYKKAIQNSEKPY